MFPRHFVVMLVCMFSAGHCRAFDGDDNLIHRIVNGEPVPKGERRFQVAIIKDEKLLCGGSLLTPRHILTAAHCVYKINASSLSIRYGTYNYHEGETIPVKQCHLHPNFEMINMFDDIAVVEMNDTIPLNNNNSDIVEFVSLGQQEPAAGVTVIVSGWGDVGADKGESSQLLWTSLVVSDRSKCKHKWRQSYEVTDKVLCAKATAKAGSFCHGDSGGPLTLSNGTQVGIVSITFPDCSAADHPNLFTNVWRYQQFIERIIHTHSHEY